MGNGDLQQFANNESQKFKDNLKPNINGEDLKKKAGNAAVMGTIGIIAAFIKNGFKIPKPLKEIDEGLILIGTKYREGLSSIDIAGRIIERKKEIGIGIGPLPSGAKNIDLQMEVIRVEEITRALMTGARVDIEIAPGQMVTLPNGVGSTTKIIKCNGIIR
jgi:hypothetical protein